MSENRYFKEQDGLKYHFENRIIDKKHEFPRHRAKSELVEQYVALEKLLNEKWHEKATLGAAVSGDGLLTDHGVEHIETVMHNAYRLIGDDISRLCGYEIYFLLLAIHFHDLGNIYGRKDHEKKIYEVINELGSQLPCDDVEKRYIIDIAQAHGGYCGEDKDTIRHITDDETCHGVCMCAKMLAAILRFADEISDDLSRAECDIIDTPDANKVFHAYSKALEAVSIEGETIKFKFRIPYEHTQSKLCPAPIFCTNPRVSFLSLKL